MHFYTFLAEPAPPPGFANMEIFASMIGQELVSYHLQNQQLQIAQQAAQQAQQKPLPNGVHVNGNASERSDPPPSRESDISSTDTQDREPGEIVDGVSLKKLQNLTKTEFPASPSSTTSSQSAMLDTATVAQRIREILSLHNIGQRLFAKHVLGLSQGTVSELLSKPKHWDKLTEKGRESYRKMFAWSCDENNVLALKAISPKKGNLFYLYLQ